MWEISAKSSYVLIVLSWIMANVEDAGWPEQAITAGGIHQAEQKVDMVEAVGSQTDHETSRAIWRCVR
jgi:hypothetical protein